MGRGIKDLLSTARPGSKAGRPRFKPYLGHISIIDDLYREQERRCAICKTPEAPGKKFFLDHDHRTMKIRGLLCCSCNSGIGLLKDSPEVLQDAAAYLKKHRGW